MKFFIACLSSILFTSANSAFINPVPLATFDGKDSKTTWSWRIVNDPVMGGQSHATLDFVNSIGVWNGTCAIVPSLKAPGFSNVETSNGFGVVGGFANDASKSTHLVMKVKSSVAYKGFKVSLAADTLNPQFKSHKADIDIPVSSDFIEVSVPFTEFSNNWSAYTGEAVKKCSEDSTVCLTAHNLSHISQIGVWAEGVEGDFHVEIQSIYAATLSAADVEVIPGFIELIESSEFNDVVPLATFDSKDSKTTWSWKILNDPVMGGQSHATLDFVSSIGVWSGTCEIVPKLSAPGFSVIETTNGFGVVGGFANDASKSTHLVMKVKSSVAYKGFKVSLAADTLNPQFKSHKADIDIPVSSDFIEVSVPFTEFSNNWSAYTGEAVKKCSEDSTVCLTAHNLSHISQIGVWAEGVEGDFHVEIQSIYAATLSTSFTATAADVVEVTPTTWKNSYCPSLVQKSLRYNMSTVDDRLDNLPIDRVAGQTLAEAICCDARYDDFAEPNSLFSDVNFFAALTDNKGTTFFDSSCGIPLFFVAASRYETFKSETAEHGWPSFRDVDIINKNNLKVDSTGHVYSSCGTHLGIT